MTPAQCRAARALIGWSQDELAAASEVAKATIANFELGKRTPYARTLEDLCAALEAAGVEFTNGGQPGVRMKAGYKPPPAAKPEFTPFGGEPGIQTLIGNPRRPRPRDGND